MNDQYLQRLLLLMELLLVFLLLVACGQESPVPTDVAIMITETMRPSETVMESTPSPVRSTATPIPLAALVNGEPITMEEFRAELSQYNSVQLETGTNLATDVESIVLENLINQLLLAQSAYESGFSLDETDLYKRLDELTEKLGGSEALEDWYTKYGYSGPGFRITLARSIAAAWMRDQVISDVPTTTEQVHAKQILLFNEDQAKEVFDLLQSGQDFDNLASSYDPITFGELGWFPRGYLTQPEVEQAAFSLQPGELSQVIQSDIGYHIVKVVDRDPQHYLNPDAYALLQVQALREWMEEHRQESEIQVFLP